MKHFYLIVCAFLLSAAFTVVAADKPQCARKIEIGKNVGAVLEPNKVQIVLANKFKSTRFAAEELAELLGEVVTDSTKKNLELRVEAEMGACAGKFEIAKKAKAQNLDAIHDTVHEMAKDEARHGQGFAGLLKRYF